MSDIKRLAQILQQPDEMSSASRLVIRDQRHLDRLMKNAESDDALLRIRRALERQGMDTSGLDNALGPGFVGR